MIDDSHKLPTGQQAWAELVAADARSCDQMLENAARRGSVSELTLAPGASVRSTPLMGDGYALGGAYNGQFKIETAGNILHVADSFSGYLFAATNDLPRPTGPVLQGPKYVWDTA